MDEVAIRALACPLDGQPLDLAARMLGCDGGHRFDLARQGYVNLLRGRGSGTGDDAAMVAARAQVLAAGRFAPVTAALADLVAGHLGDDGVVLDVGAGTGHHLAGVLDAVPERSGVALDLSVYAARRAARAHRRAVAVVADVWRGLPLRDRSVAAVTCVFAPRNAAEIARVLRPDGVLVVVTPLPHHLGEMVGPLGLLEVDPRKEERLLAGLDPRTRELGVVRRVETRWRLTRDEVGAVVAMGPSADHLDASQLTDRVATLPPTVPVTAAVELRLFRPR